MWFKRTDSEVNQDTIQLIASILVCYPEIARVTFEPKDKSLLMVFSFNDVPEEKLFNDCREYIMDSLQLYHDIEGYNGGHCGIAFKDCGLQISRDIDTLSQGELNLIVSLVKDKFGKMLEADDNRQADPEMLSAQAEIMEHRFISLKEHPAKKMMVGIREEGRVMVYGH